MRSAITSLCLFALLALSQVNWGPACSVAARGRHSACMRRRHRSRRSLQRRARLNPRVQASPRVAAGGSMGGPSEGLLREDIARLERLRALEDEALQRRRLASEVSGVPCTYDSECAAGTTCKFDWNAYLLGLCFSRCGLCS